MNPEKPKLSFLTTKDGKLDIAQNLSIVLSEEYLQKILVWLLGGDVGKYVTNEANPFLMEWPSVRIKSNWQTAKTAILCLSILKGDTFKDTLLKKEIIRVLQLVAENLIRNVTRDGNDCHWDNHLYDTAIVLLAIHRIESAFGITVQDQEIVKKAVEKCSKWISGKEAAFDRKFISTMAWSLVLLEETKSKWDWFGIKEEKPKQEKIQSNFDSIVEEIKARMFRGKQVWNPTYLEELGINESYDGLNVFFDVIDSEMLSKENLEYFEDLFVTGIKGIEKKLMEGPPTTSSKATMTTTYIKMADFLSKSRKIKTYNDQIILHYAHDICAHIFLDGSIFSDLYTSLNSAELLFVLTSKWPFAKKSSISDVYNSAIEGLNPKLDFPTNRDAFFEAIKQLAASEKKIEEQAKLLKQKNWLIISMIGIGSITAVLTVIFYLYCRYDLAVGTIAGAFGVSVAVAALVRFFFPNFLNK